jgi:inner membrane protein
MILNTEIKGFSLSMGFKLLVVCGLALFMSLLALFINNMVEERTDRAKEVSREVSALSGGPQTFLGPTLLVPYAVPAADPKGVERRGVYVVFPETAVAGIQTTTEERRRSLFKVPVFKAHASLEADFNLTGVPNAAPATAILDWSRAEIVVGVSDARGAMADATLTTAAGTTTLMPASTTPFLTYGEGSNKPKLVLFGTPTHGAVQAGSHMHVTAAMHFSGAQRIALLPYGKSTRMTMHGDWASPGFDGNFLPSARKVSPTGFEAQWNVPYIARGVRAEGDAQDIAGLDGATLGTTFVEVADPYQSVNRSLKYAPLFLGLVFLSYLLFEVTTGKRVHPAQYVLVGVAQLIFYLLLLSFAERIGFNAGYLLAGGATVLLLSTNTGWVFAARKQGLRAFAIFGTLYGMIYMLLRLEDNALMLGSIGSFIAIAVAMYLTRGIDWYGIGSAPKAAVVQGLPGTYRVGEL